jgi:hypothetical protein
MPYKKKVHGLTVAQKLQDSKNADNSLLGTLMMTLTLSFPTRIYFCCKRNHNQHNSRVYSVLLIDITQRKSAVKQFQNVSRVAQRRLILFPASFLPSYKVKRTKK